MSWRCFKMVWKVAFGSTFFFSRMLQTNLMILSMSFFVMYPRNEI